MISWSKPIEPRPMFYTFTKREDFLSYIKENTDIYTEPLPSKILKGEVVLSRKSVVTKDRTYNVVGAWFDITQPAFLDDAGMYGATPWGFIATEANTNTRSRARSPDWHSSVALRAKMIATKGLVVDYKGTL